MRIKFTRIFLILLFLTVLARLFYWQVVMADELSAKAENQHFQDLKTQAKRGDILFSDNFILVSSKPTYLLYGLPKLFKEEDKSNVATKLAKILTEEEEEELSLSRELKDKLSEDLYWVVLQRNVELEIKKKIESLKIKGLGFEKENSRFYPEGSSAAHLLGFVASNSKGEDTGYFGLEGFYNGELKGMAGNIRQEKDAAGLPILIGQSFGNFGKDGKNLILNIDRAVQYIVEKALRKGFEKYEAKGASAVVLDPKTGAVLALATYPNYDPANFSQFAKEYYKNSIVADSFEPGSIFKVLVMAAALNEHIIKPDTKCDSCAEAVQIGGFTIRTWNNKYYPETTMEETIIHSDNTGMVFVSRKLGLDKLYSYLVDFGFGQETGIDLQDEFSPNLRSKESWREIDLATSSFGQGIAVTPIQMVAAVASLASGGNLMQPQVVKAIEDDNKRFEIKPKFIRRVISEEAAKVLTEMMVKAVDEGEAKWAKPKGFKIAGKTGTAQIPVAGHYDPNKTIASFVGFAPADSPKFVILVLYNQPSVSIFGSETAAPTFFEIAKELFTYYRIAPTEAQ